MYFPLWKLALVALPQLGVQVTWCFIGPNAAPYMGFLGVGASLATLNNIAGPITGFFTGPLVGAWLQP
ncbi:Peptidylprolyl isomerase [Durusdinium trenchii]|uniref:Peptidylprolyl isomerase n=1 Tax=Durusdinium trenchii TaxID=1381693 RepID=A0ABP0MG13_9DINO